jgi:hypothetical protein
VVPRNSSKKKSDAEDGIAEDVRKIKESMKELVQQPQPSQSTSAKKTRTPAAKTTTPKVRSQATKRERKSNSAKDVKEPPSTRGSAAAAAAVVEEEKPKVVTHALKNELLADWLDDDDIGADKIEDGKRIMHTICYK